MENKATKSSSFKKKASYEYLQNNLQAEMEWKVFFQMFAGRKVEANPGTAIGQINLWLEFRPGSFESEVPVSPPLPSPPD